MAQRRIPWLAAVWACFFVRLLFYSSMLPLWEGYDEWAHFAVVRAMAFQGELLPPRDAPVPRDVEASMQLAPVPWEMRYLPPPAVSEDNFWTLPAQAREERQAAFRAMPAEWSRESAGGLKAYEALQPPLYYWLMAPVLRVMSGASLVWQVTVLRWISVLIASLVVPLVFGLGLMVFADERVAVGAAAVIALMPGIALDVARVGNDSLSVVLFTLLTLMAVMPKESGRRDWLLVCCPAYRWLTRAAAELGPRAATVREVRMARGGPPKVMKTRWLAVVGSATWAASSGERLSILGWDMTLGLVLGLGLLTKVYFLTAVPALALALGRRAWRPFAAAAVVAGWWYVRNLAITGTLTGLSESVMLRDLGAWGVLRRAPSLPWRTAADAILFSHLYFGGWSSLTVRSWMYHVFYSVVLLATIGLARRWLAAPIRGMDRPIRVLAALYGMFWLGEFYNALLEWLSKGLPGSMGWYLYAAVGAEVVLCVAGLAALVPRRWGDCAAGWAAAGGAILFMLLDLYTVHAVAIPYYTGMVRHKANGATGTLHLADFQAVGWSGAFGRLSAFHATPQAVLVVLWAAYVAATVLALAAALRAGSATFGRGSGFLSVKPPDPRPG